MAGEEEFTVEQTHFNKISTSSSSFDILQRWTIVLMNDNEIERALNALDKSVMIEIKKVKCGFWEQTMPMFIMMETFDNVERLLQNKYFVRHSNIRLIELNSESTLINQMKYYVWSGSWMQSKLIPRIHKDSLEVKPPFDLKNSKVFLINRR